MKQIESHSAQETAEFGRRLASELQPGDVVALTGELGTGKTCLVKGIAAGLGISQEVTSPTFTLISQYRGLLEGRPVDLFHVDLYRLAHEPELEDLGLEELMGGEGITVIEWGEKASSLLPEDAVRVRIDLAPDGTRRIRVEGLAI